MTHREYSGQLLDRTFLRLLPDVFFHPVWTHFVETGIPFSSEQIQSLLDAGDGLLSAGELVEACQILFICAFQQLRAGDFTSASNNTQRILILAEQHGLPQVAQWATWGAAAVCVWRGWFQEAAEHLEHLQSLLSQQQEWVISNVIDIIRRALLSQSRAEITAGQPLSSDAVLSAAFEQMLHWGTPRAASAINMNELIDGRRTDQVDLPPDAAGSTRQSLWQKFKRIARGELQLKWVETKGSARPPQTEGPGAFIPLPPVTVTGLVAAPLLPSLNKSSTFAEDQEPTAPRPSAPDRPKPAAESPAPPSITGHPPLPAVIEESESRPIPVLPATAQRALESYPMAIYCLGPFRVYQHQQLIEEWNSLKGQAVLKYLVAHRGTPIAKDVLMDVFWLNADPEAARRNLHQAIYSLRQTLRRRDPNFQHIQFENNQYLLNPALSVWIDVEEFQTHFQSGRRLEAAGQLGAAMIEYSTAAGLYQGDFLEEDLYDDWPRPQREQLRTTYLDMADRLSEYHHQQGEYPTTIALCQKILTLDNCVEEAHRRLMRCYLAQGQRHLAIRQYHTCVQALAEELGVPPADETRSLYASISANL